MAIELITSRTRPVGKASESSTDEVLEMRLPIRDMRGQPRQARFEEHVIELASENVPDMVIKLALQINPRHGGDASATATIKPATRAAIEAESGTSMTGATAEFEAFTPRAYRWVSQTVEEFFAMYPKWGKIALLKAAGLDHRLLVRLERGEPFRTSTIDDLFQAMTKAARGELDPEAFRSTGRTSKARVGESSVAARPKGPARGRSSKDSTTSK